MKHASLVRGFRVNPLYDAVKMESYYIYIRGSAFVPFEFPWQDSPSSKNEGANSDGDRALSD